MQPIYVWPTYNVNPHQQISELNPPIQAPPMRVYTSAERCHPLNAAETQNLLAVLYTRF